MKTGIKYTLSAVAVALALVGCGNKDDNKPKEKTPTAQEQMNATKDLVVTERPAVVCDDAGLKNRVVAKVQDELMSASLAALGDKGKGLEQQLKARLSATTIEVQDIRQDRNECQASLHIVLSPQDVSYADRAFKAARLASLDEQAVERNVSLLGGNRLVSDFIYQADGDAVAISSANPAIALAGRGLAQAVVAMNKENRSTARQSAPAQPKIVPAPNVAIVPPPTPRPVPSTSGSSSSSGNTQRTTPTPESAILQSDDVPRQEREAQSMPSDSAPNPQPTPKAEPKPKAESVPKVEPKPKAEPKPTVNDTSSQITVVESDDTY